MKLSTVAVSTICLALLTVQPVLGDGGPADLGPVDTHEVSKTGTNQKILVIYVQGNDYRILASDLATQNTEEDQKVADFSDWYVETSWGETSFDVTQQRDAGGNWYTLPKGILDYSSPSEVRSMEHRDVTQASASNPTPPASVTASAAASSGSDPTSDFDADEAGDYWYAVSGFRNGVESTLTRIGAAVSVAEDDIVKLTITKPAANDVDRYIVYRTGKGQSDSLGNYRRIGYADVTAATDEYIDQGRSLNHLSDHHNLLEAAMTAADGDVPDYEAFSAIITIIYSPFLRGQAAGASTYTVGGNTFKIQTINQSSSTGFGRFTHEIGHWLGLPDQYGFTGAGRGYWTTMDGANDRQYATWEKDHILSWIANPANIKPLSRPAPGDPDIDETFKVVPTAVEELAADTYTALKINSSDSVNYYVEARDALPGNASDASANSIVVVMEAVDAWPPGIYPKRTLNEQKVMSAGAAAHQPDPSIEVRYLNANVGPPESYNVNVKIKAHDRPDPSITRWGAPPWETTDIWIDSEREGGGWDDPATAVPKPSNGEHAWVGHVNRVYARITNVGPGDATGVTVRFRVNTPGGVGDAGQFVDLPTPAAVDIPAGESRNVYADWTPTVGSHTCIEVETEHIPGEEDIYNNHAQENVTHFYSGSSSPWQPVSFPVRIANPFDEPKRVDLEIDGLERGWSARLSNKWVGLEPKSIKTVHVTITPPPDEAVCTELYLDLYGMTQIDDFIQVYGGMNPVIHLANPIEFERHVVTPADQEPRTDADETTTRRHYRVTGMINPALPGVEIATIVTDPQGEYSVYFDTSDQSGTFANTFPVDQPGTWTAYSYYAGDDCNAPTESERTVFVVPFEDAEPLQLLDYACFGLHDTDPIPDSDFGVLHLSPAMAEQIQAVRLVPQPIELCTPIVKGGDHYIEMFMSSPESFTLSMIDYVRYAVDRSDPVIQAGFEFEHENPLQSQHKQGTRLEGPVSFLTPATKGDAEHVGDPDDPLLHVEYACFAVVPAGDPLPENEFDILHVNPLLLGARGWMGTEFLREACLPVVKADTPTEVVDRLAADDDLVRFDRLSFDASGVEFPVPGSIMIRHIHPGIVGFEQQTVPTEVQFLLTPATKRPTSGPDATADSAARED